MQNHSKLLNDIDWHEQLAFAGFEIPHQKLKMACYIILYSYQSIQDLILLLTALLFLFFFFFFGKGWGRWLWYKFNWEVSSFESIPPYEPSNIIWKFTRLQILCPSSQCTITREKLCNNVTVPICITSFTVEVFYLFHCTLGVPGSQKSVS